MHQNSEIKITDDGSHTLFVPEIDECYHSTKGAIQESSFIFIEAGLKQCDKSEINLLEIGFGTGLNALLTALQISPQPPKKGANQYIEPFKSTSKFVNYISIELFPITVEQAQKLNYPEIIDEECREIFDKIHTSEWNKSVHITDNFALTKIHSDFTTYDLMKLLPESKFDVIYFDAFSPEKQPEMWSEEMFEKLFSISAENVVITTYSAKGAVRRAMKSAGFLVERLPGPPGKREILRGRRYSF